MSVEKDPYVQENPGPGVILPEHLYVSESLTKPLLTFGELFGVPQKIYYPCCGGDTSIASAFPNSSVTFCDIADGATSFKDKGLNFIQNSAKEWIPEEEQDVLFMLNPNISPDRALESVKKSGFVIVNNYHGTAEEIYNNPKYSFLGAINQEGEWYEKNIAENHFKRVETDREWESVGGGGFSYTETFKNAQDVVHSVGPVIGSIIDNYTRIYTPLADESGGGMVSIDNHVLFPLPRKWGSVDFLYIFQKR